MLYNGSSPILKRLYIIDPCMELQLNILFVDYGLFLSLFH